MTLKTPWLLSVICMPASDLSPHLTETFIEDTRVQRKQFNQATTPPATRIRLEYEPLPHPFRYTYVAITVETEWEQGMVR
jgi:hypothetical protein